MAGELPFGWAPSGELTAYTPTLRERAADWLRPMLFSDDRAGQDKANRLVNWGETMIPPFGFATSAYDAGRAGGEGNYAQAAMLAGLAAIPGPELGSGKSAARSVSSVMPRKVYHGTNDNFTEFRIGLTPDDHVPGISVSQNPDEAGSYGANLMELSADIKNPIGYPELEDWARQKATQKGVEVDPEDFSAFNIDPDTLKQWLVEDGFDAIDYSSDPLLGYGIRVLDPAQLKILSVKSK